MNWRNIFNIQTRGRWKGVRGEPRPAGADETATGAFVTPQTLATFPVATAVIGIMWKVIETLVPSSKGSLWIPAIISLLLGGFLFYVAISDPQASRTKRDTLIALGVAIVNTFYLFAASTGIVKAVT